MKSKCIVNIFMHNYTRQHNDSLSNLAFFFILFFSSQNPFHHNLMRLVQIASVTNIDPRQQFVSQYKEKDTELKIKLHVNTKMKTNFSLGFNTAQSEL